MTRPRAASLLSAASPFSLRHYQSDISSHSHDFAQLVIPLGGPIEIEVQGQGRRLAPGFVCVIAPGERHDYAADPALSWCRRATGSPAIWRPAPLSSWTSLSATTSPSCTAWWQRVARWRAWSRCGFPCWHKGKECTPLLPLVLLPVSSRCSAISRPTSPSPLAMSGSPPSPASVRVSSSTPFASSWG
ncbi:AraC family ligand binding domain-containing protein [Aeromonas piscicola]|uniref:AraC family ligand binding domain-containing protein n=1 Tax=Aeromonas piscicola TaxID=600645 RepID=UPI00338DEE16